MVKDRSIFINRIFGRKRSNRSRIIDFLKGEDEGFCDDCLSLRLQIFPRQQVNQICRKLQSEGIVYRRRGICHACGRNKIINFLGAKSARTIVPERSEESRSQTLDEEQIREIMSRFLGVSLSKDRLSIFGKEKEFDIVNIEAKIVGDIKSYRYSGTIPSAEYSTLCEYVWLMEKLEESSKCKWRKIIVGSGNRNTFENYAKKYHPWLGSTEIYFADEKGEVQKIRDAIKLYL